MATFRGWLKQFKGDPSPLGDLANDAFNDPNWTGRTVKSLRERLHAVGVGDYALEALNEAERLYRDK